MFDVALQMSIARGLDYTSGRVFLEFFSRAHHPTDALNRMRTELEEAVRARSHFKATHVKADCMALRALLKQADAGRAHFGFLDILEAYAPALAARKLSELLRVAAFESRQMELFR